MGEISDVSFQIGQIKAPGPDGFYSRFIKGSGKYYVAI
jgi:hypothetical protein